MFKIVAAISWAALVLAAPAVAEAAKTPTLRTGEKDLVSVISHFSAVYGPYTACILRVKEKTIENARVILRGDKEESIRFMASQFAATDACKDDLNAAGRICSEKLSETACAVIGTKIADQIFSK